MIMPGIVLNSTLGLLPDRTRAVLTDESLAVVAPMYNEEEGARRCLASILRQQVAPEQIAISINGGRDNTYGVVETILREYGYTLSTADELTEMDARLERWLGGRGAEQVTVVRYRSQTSKSESINNLLRQRLVITDRILLVDGDTMLHPAFVQETRRNFYRLRRLRTGGETRWVIEDYALTSGSVTSWLPAQPTRWQKLVSQGRRAEYAFSALLRRGQASQHGDSAVFGNSRLYTVVGCGFTARRELFPMPSTTRTEDHEFTLEVQDLKMTELELTPEALDSMGLRIETDGEPLRPSEFFGSQEKVLLRTGGNARFVPEALMMTEDPDSVSGYLNQVERWNGGGLEGALGRIGRRVKPNVAWAVWMAQIENILDISLMLLILPNLIALNLGNPSLGIPASTLLVWFAVNVVVGFLLNFAGFRVQRRAAGIAPRRATLESLQLSLSTLLPYLLIRYLNPFTYVAAAIEIVPVWFRQRRRRVQTAGRGISWERPRGARMSLRTQSVMVSALVVLPLLTGFIVAPAVHQVNVPGWQLTHAGQQMRVEDFFTPAVAHQPEEAMPVFCSAGGSGAVELQLPRHAAQQYRPLGLWDMLTLGRLAPLLPIIEQAALSYDLQVTDVLKVFMNESLYDPLAHGPTGDFGLSQLTSDALTLLATASRDPQSVIYNPDLITVHSNVFDPVFSACAGAAKLAWAFDQPLVSSLDQAYALFINPVYGFVNGRIGETWVPLVAQMDRLEPNIQVLAAAYRQYLDDPSVLSGHERQLISISFRVAAGELDLPEAYAAALQVVADARIDDLDVYRNVLSRLYGTNLAAN